MANVRRETLAEQAASAIREEIYSAALPAGAKVNIDDAAERLGMSQIPVREALRALSAVGLVEFVPQRGYTVSPASLEDFLDTYRLRLVLDPLAARLSAPNLTDDDIEAARRALERLEGAIRTSQWDEHRRSHRAFHFALYNGCNSPWLMRVLEMLWENSERYQRISAERRGTPDERAREHGLILAAAETRDGEKLAEAMLFHISRTESTIERWFESQAEPVKEPVPASS